MAVLFFLPAPHPRGSRRMAALFLLHVFRELPLTPDAALGTMCGPLLQDVFAAMENLHVLNIMGNPVRKHMSNYRKTMIVRCKHLTYLDDRPVRDKERACAEAWHRGGREEERAERERWNARERAQQKRSVDYLISLRRDRSDVPESGSDLTETENSEQSGADSGWSESEQSASETGSAVDPSEGRNISEVDGEGSIGTPPPLEAVDLATLQSGIEEISAEACEDPITGPRAPDMLFDESDVTASATAAAEELVTITGPRAPESLWSDGEEEVEATGGAADQLVAVRETRSNRQGPAGAGPAHRVLIEDVTGAPDALGAGGEIPEEIVVGRRRQPGW